MDSIIVAHLPDFETWQTSCLLFDNIPLSKQNNTLCLYDKIFYKNPTIEGIVEILLHKESKLKIMFGLHELTISSYPKNGELGNCISFYRTGKIYSIFTVRGTLEEGKYSNYDEKHIMISLFDNGKLHGKYISYYDNGGKMSERNYENGKYHGEYIQYYRNGNIRTVDNFILDKKHGESIEYDEDNRVIQKCHYISGLLHGEFTVYYDNGNLKQECNYKNGERHGKYTDYHENGNLRIECDYEDGKLHGRYVEYYEDGKTKEERSYVYNKLQEIHNYSVDE